MATLTRSSLHSIGLILIFMIHHASSAQSSGILSGLYKKAAQENRPLILVLENSKGANALTGKSRDTDYSPNSVEYSSKNYYEPSKKQSALDSDRDDQSLLPYLLLQNLGQQNSESRYQSRNYKAHDHSLSKSKSRSRLRNRSRDRRLRLRSQLANDDNIDRDNRDRRDRDKDDRDRRDRDRRDRDLNSIKSFIAKNIADEREPHEKERDAAHDRALRSSVIKNLLRYSNDLNCEAKDECANECDNNYSNIKKKDACENKCEQKYECEEEKESDGCELSDECGEEKDQLMSTRGERLVTEKDTCKRC